MKEPQINTLDRSVFKKDVSSKKFEESLPIFARLDILGVSKLENEEITGLKLLISSIPSEYVAISVLSEKFEYIKKIILRKVIWSVLIINATDVYFKFSKLFLNTLDEIMFTTRALILFSFLLSMDSRKELLNRIETKNK